MPLNYHSLGEIRNIMTNNCLDTFGRKSGEDIAITRCHGQGGNQVFAYTKAKQIMSDDNCMDFSVDKHGAKKLKLVRCHGLGGNQAWEYDRLTKQIMHVKTRLCLDRADSKGDPTKPQMTSCNAHKFGQKWEMVSNFKWQSKKNDGNAGDDSDNKIEN